MSKWLFDILKNNTIVDNQTYNMNYGVITNFRFNEALHLSWRESGQHYKVHNNEDNIWSFLNSTHRELRDKFSRIKDKAIVLFNERDYEHNSEDDFINLSGIDCKNFTLKTGNIIGYLKKGDYAIKISSRFGDNFLKYIISDADGFLEIENYGGSNKDEGYEWLLIYLWKTKLKKAYRLGLPKKYISKNNRLNKIRGNINIVDYYSYGHQKGTYECNYREHSYNNEATRLISSTFHKIGTHEFLQDLTLLKNAFFTATEGQKISRRELHRVKHFTNPFYKDYNEVINLSKLLLKDEISDFGDQSENSAFFFDVSMLFEYFIRKLLKRNGYSVQNKFENRMDIATGSALLKRRKLEPDIFFNHNGKNFLFDVKYKSFDFLKGVSREDLFQLHTYVGQYGNNNKIKACGFIYPLSESSFNSKLKNNCYIRDSVIIMNEEIEFYILFIQIPEDHSDNYNTQFSKKIEDFISTIKLLIE